MKSLSFILFLLVFGTNILASNADGKAAHEESTTYRLLDRAIDYTNAEANRYCEAHGIKILALIAISAVCLLGAHYVENNQQSSARLTLAHTTQKAYALPSPTGSPNHHHVNSNITRVLNRKPSKIKFSRHNIKR